MSNDAAMMISNAILTGAFMVSFAVTGAAIAFIISNIGRKP